MYVLTWLAGNSSQGVSIVDGEVTGIVAGELVPEVVDLDSLVDDDGLEDMEADSEGHSGDCCCLHFGFLKCFVVHILCFVIFRI